jgi:DNA-directed RNA polymerase subunit E'/Rpb7
MESKIFTKVHLTDVVKLAPKFIGPRYHDCVLEKLSEKIEGKCSHHGYIKKGSINILKMMPGKIEHVALNGYVLYNVSFTAEVCNPLVGSIVKCRVVNTNKFGILAEAGFFVNTDYVNVLDIIIAKTSVNMTSEIDLEKISIGDQIIIEVMGKKYQLNDAKIYIVGRVINDEKKVMKKNVPPKNNPIIDDADADPEGDDIPEGDIQETGEDDEAVDGDEEEEEEEEEEDDEIDVDDDDKPKKGGAFFSDDDESALSLPDLTDGGGSGSTSNSDIDDD